MKYRFIIEQEILYRQWVEVELPEGKEGKAFAIAEAYSEANPLENISETFVLNCQEVRLFPPVQARDEAFVKINPEDYE